MADSDSLSTVIRNWFHAPVTTELRSVNRKLSTIIALMRQPIYGYLVWSINGQSPKEDGEMVTIPRDAPGGTVALKFVDAKGGDAKVDGIPVWQNSNDAALLLAVAADGMSASFTLPGAVGIGQVRVDADADLGDGVRPLIVLGDYEVIPGEAVAGELVFTVTPPA